jgi:hypothetical protein
MCQSHGPNATPEHHVARPCAKRVGADALARAASLLPAGPSTMHPFARMTGSRTRHASGTRKAHAFHDARSSSPTPCPTPTATIHLGHLVGYIQADIWVRLPEACAAIEVLVRVRRRHSRHAGHAARGKRGPDPRRALINRVHGEHSRDFARLRRGLRQLPLHPQPTKTRWYAEDIYTRLRDGRPDSSTVRSIEQFYDPVKEMFLPDRFIKGECPKCGAADQYGDNCEACGAAYAPTELKNPYSAVSGAKPVLRTSEHYFFKPVRPAAASRVPAQLDPGQHPRRQPARTAAGGRSTR